MIDKGTYKDRVIEFLYEQLRRGKLLAGEKVYEAALARQLQISRAPIREALKQMVGDGLFEYRPQVGTFVASFLEQDIVDAYITRGLLEGFSVASALAAFSGEDYRKLQGFCHEMERLASENEQLALIELGRDFHSLLFKRCENRQLIEYTERLSSKLHLLFYLHWASLYTPGELNRRHTALLTIMQAGDAVQVEQAFREHYLETGMKIVELQRRKQQHKES